MKEVNRGDRNQLYWQSLTIDRQVITVSENYTQ